MKFIMAGTSHRFSPLEIRDRLSFSGKKLREASRSLQAVPKIRSFLILSTCNRSEVYGWCEEGMDLRKVFCGLHGIPEEELAPFLYVYEEQDALRHFVRVMCGLDSQMVGESQILGQVRQAVRYSEDIHALNSFTREFVLRAIEAAEKVRRETKIEYFSGTVADAAFDLLQRNSSFVREKRFLLVGTGKVMGLFVPLLAREDIRPVIVSNRNHEKAVEWAHVLGGSAGHLEDLPALIPDSDIIISATSCPRTVLHQEHFRGHKKPVLVLDLAVPRDADASIKEVPGVRLFDLDDLGSTAIHIGPGDWVDAAERRVFEKCGELWKELSGSEQEKVLSR